jgi:aarF domain-containing kinase
VYDPVSITAYWGKRPRSVATRIVQLLSVAGGFLSRVAWDVINKKVKEVMLLCQDRLSRLPALFM